MEKQRFVRLVGETLIAASERDEFDRLLLVAPPGALPELREALDDVTRAKLVKTPDHELGPHVREWVDPVRRPVA